MSKITVSVIIPTYKRSGEICRAVDSVLSQTLSSFEVIVVDDNGINTPDGEKTAEAMKKYDGDSRVIYLRHAENKNGSAARNTGIKASSGEYISFLDDDDAYLPERLEMMCDKMQSLGEDFGACYTGYVKHLENGKNQFSGENVSGDIFLKTLMRSFYLGSGSNMFFRRNTVDKTGLFDETFKRNQDLEYLIRVTKNFKMAYVDKVLLECFYDVRTAELNYEKRVQREKNFREKFSHYLQGLSKKEQKAVVAMWNIDWVRIMLSSGRYLVALRDFVKSRIPLKALFGYLKYIIDRKKHNTCYGYTVKL